MSPTLPRTRQVLQQVGQRMQSIAEWLCPAIPKKYWTGVRMLDIKSYNGLSDA